MRANVLDEGPALPAAWRRVRSVAKRPVLDVEADIAMRSVLLTRSPLLAAA
jgi:hypothetical protein